MKNIPLENLLCIYDEGELVATYGVKKTKADIAKALKDYGYFDDFDEDDWEIGIGDDECHSVEDIAQVIVDNNEFYDELVDRFFGINGHNPRNI